MIEFTFPTFKAPPHGVVGAAIITSIAGLDADPPYIEVQAFEHCAAVMIPVADLDGIDVALLATTTRVLVRHPIGTFETVGMLDFIQLYTPTASTRFGASLAGALHVRTTAAERDAGRPAVIATVPNVRSLPLPEADVEGLDVAHIEAGDECSFASGQFLAVPHFGLYAVTEKVRDGVYHLRQCAGLDDGVAGYSAIGVIADRLPGRRTR